MSFRELTPQSFPLTLSLAHLQLSQSFALVFFFLLDLLPHFLCRQFQLLDSGGAHTGGRQFTTRNDLFHTSEMV